jgi:hypothetical protein
MNFKCCATGVLLWLTLAANAQTTAFTYQGQLDNAGSPATGNYDLRFRLFDSSTNLVAGPETNAPVGVTNGFFTTTLNFGSAAFDGAARVLELAVRNYGNTNAYTVLAPDQIITAVPYAIQALNASNAMELSSPLVATNITGTLPDSLLSTNVALLDTNVTFHGSVTASSFNGSLGTSNLTGILPDNLLSTNVALLDTNANFKTNVTAVLFTGSGHGLTNVPGAFFWETITTTNATASSNIGFIVTNNVAPVFISLPAAPSVGDTFKVAGVGAGGWIITQNSGQQILAGNLAGTSGLNWTVQTNSGARAWTGLASSADGTKLFATAQGYIYVSLNSGVTWTTNTTSLGSLNWSSVAATPDGSHLLATVGTSGGGSGYVYTSANSGSTWTQVPSSQVQSAAWVSSAYSANGNTLVVGSYNGYIYFSTNAGSSWKGLVLAGLSFNGVAVSDDGTKLATCTTASGGNYIYTSPNSGSTWITQSNSGLHVWSAIASSADGTHLVATVSGTGGGIYTSANSGLTWISQSQNAVDWTAVASSSDGSHLAAAYDSPADSTPGYIYTTDDSGSTWIQRFGAPNAPWTAITSAADGSTLAAAAFNGYVYTSGQSATTSGTSGYLTGGYQSALELEYVGGGVFLPLNHEGTIRAY